MSSCLSGGGRAYRLDLDILKSPTTSWVSNSSSPSSTLSESSNSPLTISTRKARTPRKRPNQTYNEAAAILSTAYPKLFPTTHLKNPFKFTKSHQFPFEPSDLLILEKPDFSNEPKLLNLFETPWRETGEVKNHETCDDFDTDSILDEEIEEGIDSIMGNSNTETESKPVPQSNIYTSILMNSCCYGYPVGLVGFDYGYGLRKELRAVRSVVDDDERDCWRFPSVNVADITKKIARIPVEKKKQSKNLQSSKGNLIPNVRENKESLASTASSEESTRKTNAGLLLKLNYDDVLNAWSEKGSPFSGEAPAGDSAGNDVQARLSQIDLFPEEDAPSGRGAIVLRNKEKRRTPVVSKKIRYQVRKVDADQRPRLKGRFVRAPNSPNND